MIHVRPFQKERDAGALANWLGARSIGSETILDSLPAIGFMAYDASGERLATAFLRMVEGGFAQLDGLCTNPAQPGEVRSQAIDKVVEHVISEAKSMGLKNIHAFSMDKNTLVRSLKHGFTATPHAMIALNLTQGTK